jgi:hypothetical protein
MRLCTTDHTVRVGCEAQEKMEAKKKSHRPSYYHATATA